VQVVDDKDRPCPPGVEGNLRIGLQDWDFSAYQDDPQISAQYFKNGFFYPGDTAVICGDGCVKPLGRKLDVVELGGHKVASAPLELELRDLLDVETVCLFTAVDSQERQELVIAVETDTALPRTAVKKASSFLRAFESVRFVYIPEFPTTQTGNRKVDRVTPRNQLFRDN